MTAGAARRGVRREESDEDEPFLVDGRGATPTPFLEELWIRAVLIRCKKIHLSDCDDESNEEDDDELTKRMVNKEGRARRRRDNKLATGTATYVYSRNYNCWWWKCAIYWIGKSRFDFNQVA
jgi:hypothetical protein